MQSTMKIGTTVFRTNDHDLVTELFQEMSFICKLFPDEKCAACGSNNLVPYHKLSKSYDFYYQNCVACGSRLRIVHTKEGDFYPERQTKEKEPIGVNGWFKWVPQGQPKQQGYSQTQSYVQAPPQAPPQAPQQPPQYQAPPQQAQQQAPPQAPQQPPQQQNDLPPQFPPPQQAQPPAQQQQPQQQAPLQARNDDIPF